MPINLLVFCCSHALLYTLISYCKTVSFNNENTLYTCKNNRNFNDHLKLAYALISIYDEYCLPYLNNYTVCT